MQVRLAAIHFFSVIFPLLDQFVSDERFNIDHELIIHKFDESLRELFLVDVGISIFTRKKYFLVNVCKSEHSLGMHLS